MGIFCLHCFSFLVLIEKISFGIMYHVMLLMTKRNAWLIDAHYEEFEKLISFYNYIIKMCDSF